LRASAKAIARKLRDALPAKLDEVRDEIRRQDAEVIRGGFSLGALEARVAAAERKLDLAAKRVLEEDEGAVPALRRHMTAMREERDCLAAELAAAQAREEPKTDLEAGVEEALAMVARLDTALNAGAGDELRSVLGEAVSRVEMLFHPDRRKTPGGKNRTAFARALIYVRPQLLPVYTLVPLPIPR
jgi:hypothetical protein